MQRYEKWRTISILNGCITNCTFIINLIALLYFVTISCSHLFLWIANAGLAFSYTKQKVLLEKIKSQVFNYQAIAMF